MKIVSRENGKSAFELIRNIGVTTCDVCAKPVAEVLRIMCLHLGRVIYVEICESCADEAKRMFE